MCLSLTLCRSESQRRHTSSSMCGNTPLIIYTVQPRLCQVGSQVLWLLMQSVKCNWKVQRSLLFQGFCLCLSCDANHERGGCRLYRPLTSEMNWMTFGDSALFLPYPLGMNLTVGSFSPGGNFQKQSVTNGTFHSSPQRMHTAGFMWIIIMRLCVNHVQ